MPIEDVLAAILPVNLLLSGYLVLKYRRSVDTGLILRRVVLWMVPGMVVGMLLFTLREHAIIRTIFAVFVVGLAASELWRSRRASAADAGALPAPVAALSLLGAGIVHGLFACGGPMLVWVVGRELADKARFRATLSAVWLLLNLVLVGNYVREGTLTATSLGASGVMVVSLVVGLGIGEWVHHRLSAERFRVAVFALLLLAGGALFVRSVLEG